jgi:hypothetical protein
MPDEPRLFAIVPVPPEPGPLRSLLTSNAFMVGDKRAVMANIIDTRAQRDLRLLVARGDALMRAEEVLEAKKAQARVDALQSVCDACDQMMRRLDALEDRRALSAERERQEQKLIDTYTIPDDLPDLGLPRPDLNPTAATAPSRSGQGPASAASAPAADAEAIMGEPEGHYPAPNLQPDLRANDADAEGGGWLPEFLKEPGTELQPDPAELAHPQGGT